MGAALTLLTFIAGTGLFVILHEIGSKTQTQIKMDQRTGETVIHLRAALITLEESYHRLEIARVATILGCIAPPPVFISPNCPAFLRVFNMELKFERAIQQTTQRYWEAENLRWFFSKPWFSSKSKFPEFPIQVIDAGPAELEVLKLGNYTIETPDKIQLTLRIDSLISTAEIKSRKVGLSHEWKIAWTQ